MEKQLTAPPSTEDLARLAALSAKLRSQDPIPSRSEIAAEIDAIREVLDRREAEAGMRALLRAGCDLLADECDNIKASITMPDGSLSANPLDAWAVKKVAEMEDWIASVKATLYPATPTTEASHEAAQPAGEAEPVDLTHQQKMEALSLRFYQGMLWTPKAGDYYTTSRADLELYRVVAVEGGMVKTQYCDQSKSSAVSSWPEKEFTSEGFGPKRVWVPDFVLSARPPQPSASVVEALEAMLHAVCGETGFAACVRHDSGSAYPWPALDAAEEKARSALRALKGGE